jgi:diguanylate cyclase (GGDEF)-like protein
MNPTQRKRRLTWNAEVALIFCCTLLATAASNFFGAFEALGSFDAQYDRWQVHDLILGLVFGGFVSLIFLFHQARALRSEIALREASERKATNLARHDQLTGLPNRRVLSETLDSALAAPGSVECAVFLIDLDCFKPVNDVHGHVVGDAVLIEVAKRISDTVATKGTVARMGGDEFGCVIQYESGSDVPSRIAGQIIRALGEAVLVDGISLKIGSTVGIARSPQDGVLASALLHAADLAMYEGKRQGRGVYRFFDAELDTQLRERSALESDLRLAVSAGEIIPHFQPIMDLGTDRILGFEALARWIHPTKGLIPPDKFIPIAEDLGFIDEITYAMLRASCAAARDWPPSIWVAVNISPLQLDDPWLASRLLTILAETGIAPGRLIVEITENAIIDDMMKAKQIFSSLQNAGVRIALDDFGKGYSSLYHLRQLRFDHLKIDRSLVRSMKSPDSAKIVRAVAGLGKSLGMPVTAEGVETSAEADALRKLGCEHAQGFLFGEPLNAADTIAMLKLGCGGDSIAA